jgi:hypothetical protein
MKYIFSRKRGGVGSGGNGTALRLPKDLGSYSHIEHTLYENCLSGR